jgi:hypothetical protein
MGELLHSPYGLITQLTHAQPNQKRQKRMKKQLSLNNNYLLLKVVHFA